MTRITPMSASAVHFSGRTFCRGKFVLNRFLKTTSLQPEQYLVLHSTQKSTARCFERTKYEGPNHVVLFNSKAGAHLKRYQTMLKKIEARPNLPDEKRHELLLVLKSAFMNPNQAGDRFAMDALGQYLQTQFKLFAPSRRQLQRATRQSH